MSLTMMAIRICAVEALKAAGTLVGEQVLDSEIAPIDVAADGVLRSSRDAPFVAVYTDGAKAAQLGQSGVRSNGMVDLVFSYGVSRAMARSNKETGASEILEGIPATDAAFEATMDILAVQISRALTDGQNPWAQVLGAFVTSWESKEQLRSGTKVDSVRIAAGQLRFSVTVVADPAQGAARPPGGPWADFLQLATQAGIRQLPLIEAALGVEQAEPYPPYEQLLAMTTRVAESLQLYSFGGAPRSAGIVLPDFSEGTADG